MTNIGLWTVAAGLCLSVIYANYPAQEGYHIISLTESVVFNGLSRLTWSIGISCVIYSCSLGYGGRIIDVISTDCVAVPLPR